MWENGKTARMRVSLRDPLPVSPTLPQGLTHTSAMTWSGPAGDQTAVLLAHGAGTDMHSALLQSLGPALAARGHPVMAFNFPFTEAGRKAPDRMPRLESCFRDVIAVARERFGTRPLVVGGRSMGGRVASHLAAQGQDCAGLVFLGYPLHPAQRVGTVIAPQSLRTSHWPDIRVPTLFVQGDRDALADLTVLRRERKRLPAASSTLHVVDGADHGFALRKRDGRTADEVTSEIAQVITDWLAA